MYAEQIPRLDRSKASSLEDFLRASKEGPGARELQAEWDERKERWLENLNELFATIAGWLDQLKSEGPVSYTWDKLLSINEERVGAYKAPFMTVVFSDKRIVIKPVGTYILGGYGRVDILGPNGQRTLILKEWGDWHFFYRDGVSPSNMQLNYEPLTLESFKEEMLALIIDEWPH